MSMSRKEFVPIAEMLADVKERIEGNPSLTPEDVRMIIGRELMGICRESNSNFDRYRFIRVAALPD